MGRHATSVTMGLCGKLSLAACVAAGLFGVLPLLPAAQRIETGSNGVVSLALSPNGMSLATAHDTVQYISFCGTYLYPPQEVLQWRLKSLMPLALGQRQCFRMPSRHWVGPVVSFDRDDILLASAAGLARCSTHDGRVVPLLTAEAVVLSHDYRIVGRFNRVQGGIQFLDLKSGTTIGSVRHAVTYGRLWGFSKDGQFLVSGDIDRSLLCIWDVTSLALHSTIQAPYVGWISISADNRYIAGTGGDDSRVDIWDLHTGRKKARFHAGMYTRGATFSLDGSLLAVHGDDERGEAGLCEIRRVRDLAVVARIIDRSTFSISAVVFSHDGRVLVAGTGSGTLSSYRVGWHAAGKSLVGIGGARTGQVRAGRPCSSRRFSAILRTRFPHFFRAGRDVRMRAES